MDVDDTAMMHIRPILSDYKRLLGEVAERFTYNGENYSSEGLLERSWEVVGVTTAFRS